MNCPNKWVSITLVVIGLAACGPAAELAAAQDLASDFTVTDVMVPTRDGVHLNTKIFTPKESTEPLPIILLRTPYGIANAEGAFCVPGHPRQVRLRGIVRHVAAHATARRRI